MLFFYNCAQYLTIFSQLWAIIGHVFLRWCLYLSQSMYFFPNLIKQQQLWWSVRTKYFFHERFLFDIFVDNFFPNLMILFSTSNVLPNSFNLQFHLHLIYLVFIAQWPPWQISERDYKRSMSCWTRRVMTSSISWTFSHAFTMWLLRWFKKNIKQNRNL